MHQNHLHNELLYVCSVFWRRQRPTNLNVYHWEMFCYSRIIFSNWPTNSDVYHRKMLCYSRIIFLNLHIDELTIGFAKRFAIPWITSSSLLQFYARDRIIKSYGQSWNFVYGGIYSPYPALAIAVIAIIVVAEIQMRRRRFSLLAIQWGSSEQAKFSSLSARRAR